jgi:hypothetical protein
MSNMDYKLGHRWPEFWTQLSTLETENLLRSTIVQNVLILGQLGKEMSNIIITSNIKSRIVSLTKIDVF